MAEKTARPHDGDRAAECLLMLAEAWDQVATRCGDPTPESSPCAVEGGLLPAGIEAPADLIRAIHNDAVVYVTAAAQHLRTLAALTGRPELVLAGWPLVRSVVEYASRANWLLDPAATATSTDDPDPTRRVARFYMERIVSVGHAKNTAEATRRGAEAKAHRRSRNMLVDQAKHVFPDASSYPSLEALGEWSIGGEPYVGLAKGANDFGRTRLNAKGLYDLLSALAHPSVLQLHRQTRTTQVGDLRFQQFAAEPAVLDWQVAVACSSVYAAGHLATEHIAISPQPLLAWASSFPEAMGTVESFRAS